MLIPVPVASKERTFRLGGGFHSDQLSPSYFKLPDTLKRGGDQDSVLSRR